MFFTGIPTISMSSKIFVSPGCSTPQGNSCAAACGVPSMCVLSFVAFLILVMLQWSKWNLDMRISVAGVYHSSGPAYGSM